MKNKLTKWYFSNNGVLGFGVPYAKGQVMKKYKSNKYKAPKYITLARMERAFLINDTNKDFYYKLTDLSFLRHPSKKETRRELRAKYLGEVK